MSRASLPGSCPGRWKGWVLGFLEEGCLQGTPVGLAVLSLRLRSHVHSPRVGKRAQMPCLSLTPTMASKRPQLSPAARVTRAPTRALSSCLCHPGSHTGSLQPRVSPDAALTQPLFAEHLLSPSQRTRYRSEPCEFTAASSAPFRSDSCSCICSCWLVCNSFRSLFTSTILKHVLSSQNLQMGKGQPG